MGKFAKRIDENQNLIVDEFRKRGALVEITSTVGKGFPDIIVMYMGIVKLVEIKTESGKLTRVQKEWHDIHKAYVTIVRNVSDVKNLLLDMAINAETISRYDVDVSLEQYDKYAKKLGIENV